MITIIINSKTVSINSRKNINSVPIGNPVRMAIDYEFVNTMLYTIMAYITSNYVDIAILGRDVCGPR